MTFLVETKSKDGILSDLKSGLVVSLTAAFFLIFGITNPSYNWDIVAYVASAYHQDGLSGSGLSSAAYGDIARETGASAFKELTVGEYVDAVFNDPKSLEQQIPFYSIKAVYIQLMRSLKALGVSYPRSTYLISAIFASASVVMLALFLAHFGVPILWLPVAATVAGFGTLASYSTPDAVACFFALLMIYALIKGSRASYVIAALLPLVRTDLVILSILTMGFDFLRERCYACLVSAAAAVAIYAVINRLAGNYGWLALFNFTFIKITPYPADIQISGDISAYLKAYANGFGNLTLSRHLVIYVLAFYVFAVRQAQRLSPEINAVTVICAFYAGAHFALFPAYEDRFFAFPASLLFLCLIFSLFYQGRAAAGRRGA